ncbi:hypothetical protein EHZ19_24125 [Paraburkholderia bannensis]|uniref:Uncharacterized protein n=1 Tax=Paraburkholderia tropica TaxID=92647 RepID=A0AAQ1JVA6_9BURK|nr:MULTISPECIES: hypothetical protein [Paraburkholderia]RQM45419.1 hypothetical protein EHZ19_24125 [Paraburkholderia bannensis]RQN35167.1 hypothetical protein EHZ25_30470 [Paraburkholderia tropica]SEJ91897.1 hypothetical protein SAMN05216550_110291 [Paraburkholderia tropica]
MIDPLLSGLFGGLFGDVIGKFLGKFRLWMVFFATFVMFYLAVFITGIVIIGFQKTLPKMREFFEIEPLLCAIGFGFLAMFVAAIHSKPPSNPPDSGEGEK